MVSGPKSEYLSYWSIYFLIALYKKIFISKSNSNLQISYQIAHENDLSLDRETTQHHRRIRIRRVKRWQVVRKTFLVEFVKTTDLLVLQ